MISTAWMAAKEQKDINYVPCMNQTHQGTIQKRFGGTRLIISQLLCKFNGECFLLGVPEAIGILTKLFYRLENLRDETKNRDFSNGISKIRLDEFRGNSDTLWPATTNSRSRDLAILANSVE